jgi:hypothetical protein
MTCGRAAGAGLEVPCGDPETFGPGTRTDRFTTSQGLSKEQDMAEPKSSVELQEHMLWTYYGLRVGLGAIGIALPILVSGTGAVLHDVGLESSISAYYHSEARLPWLTTRDIFVGGLIAVGACLYLYKGFSNKENIVLNFAGAFAEFVALLPGAAAGQPGGVVSTLHGTSAVLFFLCIAYVSLFRSRDTLFLLPAAKRSRYRRLYTATGVAMVASPAMAVVLSFALSPTSRGHTVTFWVEAFAVWSFAAYWIIKTREMRESSAERRALDADLQRAIVAADATTGVEAGRAGAVESAAVEGIVPAAQR